MSEKKVIYSKRFPKESFAELGEETKQLNKESKTNDDIPEGEHIIDFLKRNRKAVPNEERIAEKDMFVRAIIDLSTTYQIDADIVEYDTSQAKGKDLYENDLHRTKQTPRHRKAPYKKIAYKEIVLSRMLICFVRRLVIS